MRDLSDFPFLTVSFWSGKLIANGIPLKQAISVSLPTTAITTSSSTTNRVILGRWMPLSERTALHRKLSRPTAQLLPYCGVKLVATDETLATISI